MVKRESSRATCVWRVCSGSAPGAEYACRKSSKASVEDRRVAVPFAFQGGYVPPRGTATDVQLGNRPGRRRSPRRSQSRGLAC